jgi:predicted nucleic acid-binding protein
VRIVYDAGALIGLERRTSRMLLVHRRAMVEGAVPIVPTIVLGQVWRGTRGEATLARALKDCRMEALDTITAKLGGQLCGQAGTSDLADAVVAVLAISYHAPIVTSDPEDLHRLTTAAGRKIEIFAV